MSTLAVRIPASLRPRIEEVAREDGVTLECFLASAAAEKLSAAWMTVEYLKRLAAQCRREEFERFVKAAPAKPPLPNDEPK